MAKGKNNSKEEKPVQTPPPRPRPRRRERPIPQDEGPPMTESEIRYPTARAIEAEAKAITARGSGYRGIMTGAGEAAQPVAKALGSYFDYQAKIEMARQEADWRKEVARQQVHQSAVKINPMMMHELDGTFISATADMGTPKHPAPISANISILSLFALGAFAEDLFADWHQIDKGILPSNLSKRFDFNRTPLTESAGGTSALPTTTGNPYTSTTTTTTTTKNHSAKYKQMVQTGLNWGLTQEQAETQAKAATGEYF